jgi:hypothetical protein
VGEIDCESFGKRKTGHSKPFRLIDAHGEARDGFQSNRHKVTVGQSPHP